MTGEVEFHFYAVGELHFITGAVLLDTYDSSLFLILLYILSTNGMRVSLLLLFDFYEREEAEVHEEGGGEGYGTSGEADIVNYAVVYDETTDESSHADAEIEDAGIDAHGYG